MPATNRRFVIVLLLSPSECYGKMPSPTLMRHQSSGTMLLASAAATSEKLQPSPHAGATARSRAALVAMTVGSAGAAPQPSPFGAWLLKYRSWLLLVCLIVHKCATDGLTRWTRVHGSYSGATVAVMSEVVKLPLIAIAVASFGGGPRQVVPIFKQAFTRTPFANAWISLCYTFNNLLYFDALSAISAVAYQVLSQSKMLFTAGLMYFMVGKRLLVRQLIAILMLIAGALLVQLQELAKASAASAGASAAASSAMWWGVGLTLFSSFISALPNVAYEKVLKTEGENQWVNNVQVTVWIMFWIWLASWLPDLARALLGGPGRVAALPTAASLVASAAALPQTLRAAFAGFSLPVWGVVMLKAMNGILIPATFKYADNILYAYAKPSSIVATTVLAAVLTRSMPSLSMALGIGLVLASIVLYDSKPKAKAQ